jgi:hypothetical protein
MGQSGSGQDPTSPSLVHGGNVRSFCDRFIEVKEDPWSGTYCKLEAGHEGPCSAHYPKEAVRGSAR